MSELEVIYFDRAERFRYPWWQRWYKGEPAEPQLRVDGKGYAWRTGVWSFWVRKLGCKFLFSREGRVHCLHPKAPTLEFLATAALDAPDATGHYRWADWQRALSQCAAERCAEVFIASRRLAGAGLGPRPDAIAIIRRANVTGAGVDTALGMRIEDAKKLPPRPPVQEAQMLEAGVRPDGIRSCLRQQLNGYVSDLNSVIGVTPIDAGAEVEALAARIRAAAGAA